MSLGEIPGGNLRAYYRLENTNDSSGNGFNLTNNNSVAFAQGRFNNGADFGSSGTNKGLTLGSNPLSAETVPELFVSFFYKLNSTANGTSGTFFGINSKSSATNGYRLASFYSISAGVITLTGQLPLSGGTLTATIDTTPDTNWHHIQCRHFEGGSNKSVIITYDRRLVSSGSGTGAYTSATSSPTIYLSIGNNRPLTNQAWAMIDELFIAESLYTPNSDNSDRFKYGTYYTGRFAI